LFTKVPGIFVHLVCICTWSLPMSPAKAMSVSVDKQPRVLQLGYFAELENALGFKHHLSEAGFDVIVVAGGEPSEQVYRVISGKTDDTDELIGLRNAIERETGNLGFVTHSPFESNTLEDIFDQPRLTYHVAQASPTPTAGHSVRRTAGNTSVLNRSPQEKIESSPGFTAGGLQITPTVGLSLGYDDNITLAHSNEISSLFYQISPAIRVELPSDHSVLMLIAAAEIVRYVDSPIDNRQSWHLRLDWIWDISTRQDLNLFAQYGDGADRRGEGRRQGDAGLVAIDPDEWERLDFGGEWDYGAVGNRGRLTLRAGASNLNYTNNRGNGTPGDLGTRALDRDWYFLGGTFYWRVAPKTSLLLDYLYTDINYDVATDFDSEEKSWMFGVTWDATARTSGTIKYGNLEKDFADPERGGFDGPTWVATIDWRPRTYSVFTLTGTRNTQEPNGGGDFVVREDLSLSWLHDWAARFGTTVDIGIGSDDYRPTTRKDDLFYWGVGARYTFNQHFRFGASVTSYNRDSVVEEFDYKQLIFLLSLEATL